MPPKKQVNMPNNNKKNNKSKAALQHHTNQHPSPAADQAVNKNNNNNNTIDNNQAAPQRQNRIQNIQYDNRKPLSADDRALLHSVPHDDLSVFAVEFELIQTLAARLIGESDNNEAADA